MLHQLDLGSRTRWGKRERVQTKGEGPLAQNVGRVLWGTEKGGQSHTLLPPSNAKAQGGAADAELGLGVWEKENCDT